jgi:hypothetical protein
MKQADLALRPEEMYAENASHAVVNVKPIDI